jgi:EVE domain
MSRSWLKLIGTTERPCPECYESCHADSRRRMHRIRPGDRMVLYAVGRGKRVFALATVSRAAYDSRRADWAYRVDLSHEVNLPAAAGVSIDEVSTAARDLVRPIQRGASTSS